MPGAGPSEGWEAAVDLPPEGQMQHHSRLRHTSALSTPQAGTFCGRGAEFWTDFCLLGRGASLAVAAAAPAAPPGLDDLGASSLEQDCPGRCAPSTKAPSCASSSTARPSPSAQAVSACRIPITRCQHSKTKAAWLAAPPTAPLAASTAPPTKESVLGFEYLNGPASGGSPCPRTRAVRLSTRAPAQRRLLRNVDPGGGRHGYASADALFVRTIDLRKVPKRAQKPGHALDRDTN